MELPDVYSDCVEGSNYRRVAADPFAARLYL